MTINFLLVNRKSDVNVDHTNEVYKDCNRDLKSQLDK